LNYDSDDASGVDLSKKFFGVFVKGRQSRLNDVNFVLGLSDVGRLANILVIVPDEEFSGWKSRFQAQAAKAPKADVFYHEQAMPEFVNKSKTKIVYSDHYHWYKEAKITLSSYSVLIKEDEQLEDRTRKLSGDRNKLEFFTKHWSLIIFHHAEQIPLSENARKAADAARGLQGTTDGKRVFVFSRAFLDLSRQNKRMLFPMGYDDKPESAPEAKRKQTTDTNKAGVRKRMKTSNQPRIVGGKIARKSFNNSLRFDPTKLLKSDEDEEETEDEKVADTHMNDAAELHTNESTMSTEPLSISLSTSDQTGSDFLTGKLNLKNFNVQNELAQGEPVAGLEKTSEKIEGSSEPPAESDSPKTTSVHDDKVQDDKVLDDNDTPMNVEPRCSETEPNTNQSMTESNVVSA